MFKVVINPKPEEQGTGITSVRRWEDPEVLDSLRKLFDMTSNEVLLQLEISEIGIVGRFGRTAVTPKQQDSWTCISEKVPQPGERVLGMREDGMWDVVIWTANYIPLLYVSSVDDTVQCKPAEKWKPVVKWKRVTP